jgi:hypothetical protein
MPFGKFRAAIAPTTLAGAAVKLRLLAEPGGAEVELRLTKWVIGVGVAAALAVGGMIWTATQILLRTHS